MILSVYILIAIHWSTLFSFIYKANTESKRDVVSCRSGQGRWGGKYNSGSSGNGSGGDGGGSSGGGGVVVVVGLQWQRLRSLGDLLLLLLLSGCWSLCLKGLNSNKHPDCSSSRTLMAPYTGVLYRQRWGEGGGCENSFCNNHLLIYVNE